MGQEEGTEEIRQPETDSGITALGRRVTAFERLETFPAPEGISHVGLVNDEVTAVCPVTGQPDFYDVVVRYCPDRFCVESKTAKLYFQQFRERGIFCEALASQVAEDFAEVLRVEVSVTVIQKPRGGISITALATKTPTRKAGEFQ